MGGLPSGRREDFEPIFFERKVEGQSDLIVDEWCEGYCRGVGFAEEAWMAGSKEVLESLAPISAFTAQTCWVNHERTDAQVQILQQAITHDVCRIHEFWLERHEDRVSGSQTV